MDFPPVADVDCDHDQWPARGVGIVAISDMIKFVGGDLHPHGTLSQPALE